MSKKIHSAEYPLEKIFSPKFSFSIPCYQPSYIWDNKQVNRLFDNIYSAFLRGPDDIYLLGCIVLIKGNGTPDADVLDGQQRLTTLTIFLAVLAEEFTGEQRLKFQNHIRQSAGCEQAPQPRLRLQEHDRSFFNDHIVGGQLNLLLSYTPADLVRESRMNILGCAKALRDKLINSFAKDANRLFSFGLFLMKRCFLIVMSTPTLKRSSGILSMLNNRRREYLAPEINESEVSSIRQVFIDLSYDPLREVYVHKVPDFDLPSGQIEYFIRLSSLAGIRRTGGMANIAALPPKYDRRKFSSICPNDLKMVFAPAHVAAGTYRYNENGEMEWGEGEPLFVGNPRFRVDKSEISGAFPFGFWGFQWETHLNYVMVEENFIKNLTEKAIAKGATINAWRVGVTPYETDGALIDGDDFVVEIAP